MTVYARSDVMSVSLSMEHGGCGATHSRPVTHGAPAQSWGLDCPACENHLRSDPHWNINLSEVPETPDEERVRLDREKKGQTNQQDLLVAAILAIAQSQQELPDNLAKAIAALSEARADQEPVITHGEAPDEEPAENEAVDLNKMRVPELRDLAASRNLDATGTRADLVARLQDEAPADAADEPED